MHDVSVTNSSRPSLRELQLLLSQVFSDPQGPRKLEKERLAQLHLYFNKSDIEDLYCRIGVYADAYFLRLKEILEGDFEATKIYLGASKFHELCVDYLQVCYPQHFNAALVASRLPRFAKEHALWSQDTLLCSLVELEWKIAESLFSPYLENDLSFDFSCAAPESLSRLSFVVDPSLRFLQQEAALEEAWFLREDPQKFKEILNQSNSLKPWIGIRRLAPCEMGFIRVSDLEKNVLESFSQGKSLRDICENFSEQEGISELVAGLGSWTTQGLLKKAFITPFDGQKEVCRRRENE